MQKVAAVHSSNDALFFFPFARGRLAGGPRAARGLLVASGVRADCASPAERIHVRDDGRKEERRGREQETVFFFVRLRRSCSFF